MSAFVFPTMGTVVSVVTEAPLPRSLASEVEGVFAAFDARFSLHRSDSELRRIADGALPLTAASDEVRDAYWEALGWSAATSGAFTPHRPDGPLDLNGIIKAHAIRDAGAVLDDAGLGDWIVNAGGDAFERRPDDRPHRPVGIADPDRRGSLLTAVLLGGSRRAIATSGRSERGDHVWGPGAGLRQVTVTADDIVTADVYATAVLAGGLALLDELTASADIDVLALRDDGRVVATGGIRLAA